MSKRSKLLIVFIGLVLLVGGCTYFISNSENDSVESVSAVEPVSSVEEVISSSLAEVPNNLISEDTDSTDYVTDNTDEKGRPVVEYTQGEETKGSELELVVDPVTGELVIKGDDTASSLPDKVTPPVVNEPVVTPPPASSVPPAKTPPASSSQAPADPSKGGNPDKLPGADDGFGNMNHDPDAGKTFNEQERGSGGFS